MCGHLSAPYLSTAFAQAVSHIYSPYCVTFSMRCLWFYSLDNTEKFFCPHSRADMHRQRFHHRKDSNKRFHSAEENNF